MGNSESLDKPAEATESEEVAEFLDENPRFLSDYIQRNPYLLDNYVYDNVDEMTVRGWLEKVKEPAPAAVLQPLKIDYQKEKNTTAHRTDKYIHNSLVVRRAERFSIDIYFKNRAYLPAKDHVVLEFSIGSTPSIAGGTKIRVPIKDTLQGSKWTSMLMNQDDELKKISVDVNIPSDAFIGRYKLTVEITSELEDGKKTERTTKPDIIVIFNPFSPGDDCYMESSTDRDEYVLNDTGKIYFGQYYKIGGMDWLFGQFEEGILDIALKLLRKDSRAMKNPEKSLKKRSSPAYCSRVLSAMVNCNDDDGILWGNWSGDYSDGKSPTSWSGSVQIMKQWNEKNEPVKYGQCWVFSGVLTTALRAIGIPARSITNFRSAHDTEFNMTIDKFINEEGEEVDSTGDSIWNFHVWNEGYFKRHDLPKGYDGWQAVDATPQEVSSGIMQCGPAPVKAVKSGEIFIGSDTNFVFGEVNADVVWWSIDASGEVTGMLKRNKRDVGRFISTKAVGSDAREDVTASYKFGEDSSEERTAFERAYAHGRKADYHDKFVIKDEGAITIDIKPVGDTINGKPITVKVVVQNTTADNHNIMVTTVMHTLLNNGSRKSFIKRSKKEDSYSAGQAIEQDILLPFGEYGHLLVDNNVIRVTTTARVKETNNLYVDTYDIQVGNPDCLKIECADTLLRRQYSEISFTITNSLPVTLTDGVFTIEASGVTTGKTVKANGPIAPGETFKSAPVEVRPYRSGRTYLYADFDANEFKNVKAAKSIRIE